MYERYCGNDTLINQKYEFELTQNLLEIRPQFSPMFSKNIRDGASKQPMLTG